jgi:hypothetical protein
MYSLPTAPAFRLTTAEALNRAYAEDEPLEPLLRQLRRLALLRAPPAERLGVLRQLAAADPGNPVWAEEVQGLEKQRLRQITTEADKAVKANDGAAIAALWNELQQTAWAVPPPPDLLNRLGSAAAVQAHSKQRQQLQLLAGQLHDAYCALDPARAAQLAQEWNARVVEARLAPEDPLHRAVAAALQWLAREDRRQVSDAQFREVLAALEQALVQPIGLEELRQYYFAVEQLGRGVPPEVEQRYLQRTEELTQAGKRREYIILAATFTVGLIVLVGALALALSRGG